MLPAPCLIPAQCLIPVLYLGPGVGLGGLIALLGIAVAVLFVVFAFVLLPIRQSLRRRKRKSESSDE